MLELIMTVAVVTVFFGAVVVALPRCMEEYITMKKTSDALEITSVLENGLATELCGSSRVVFGGEREALNYVRNQELRYFPINYDEGSEVTITSGDAYVMTVVGKPKIYGTLYDTNFYDDMSVEVVLTYVTDASSMNVKITVYDSDGLSLAVSEKPIILYN